MAVLTVCLPLFSPERSGSGLHQHPGPHPAGGGDKRRVQVHREQRWELCGGNQEAGREADDCVCPAGRFPPITCHCSVQFKMVSMCSGRRICAPPCLSGVSKKLSPLKINWPVETEGCAELRLLTSGSSHRLSLSGAEVFCLLGCVVALHI